MIVKEIQTKGLIEHACRQGEAPDGNYLVKSGVWHAAHGLTDAGHRGVRSRRYCRQRISVLSRLPPIATAVVRVPGRPEMKQKKVMRAEGRLK